MSGAVRTGGLLATCLLVCLVSSARADRIRPVLANGANGLSVASGQQLRATVGQAAVGRAYTPGVQGEFGFWVVPAAAVTGVEPGAPRGTAGLELGLAHPNPAHGLVRFGLVLRSGGTVRLRVHDVSGRRVGIEVNQLLPAGSQSLGWNAPPGTSGTLFATATVDGRPLGTRRFVLLR